MRRITSLVVPVLLISAVFVIGVHSASAATGPCTDAASTTTKATESKSSDSGHAGMDMGSGSMNMDAKTKSTKKSASHSCPTVAGAREIAIRGEAYTFTPMSLAVGAGEDVTIALSAGDIAHDLFVEGVGHIVHAKAGKTAMGGLRIDTPGTYDVRCTVKGHKKAGMTGTITVT